MLRISDMRAYLLRKFGSSATTGDPLTAPAASTNEPSDWGFPLNDDSSYTYSLPDGRKLGYAEYGSPTGRAVLILHGLACSRSEGAFYHELGLELGARIIGVDRPGMGWSSPHPGRTLLDFPKDLEHLAEHLQLNEYSVLGSSGGGPYVLACAISMPRERLKCASIVCGIGPPDIGMRGANWINWIGFTFGWRITTPAINRWFWQRDPIGRVDLTDDQRLEMMLERASRSMTSAHPKDRQIYQDESFLRLALRNTRGGFAQGFDGVLQDAKLISADFGFRIEDVRPDLPVQLWYGKHDTLVPPNHGIQIAARLGDGAHLRLEDETHASLMNINLRRQILAELVRSV